MKVKSRHSRNLLAAALLALAAGCGGQPPKEIPPTADVVEAGNFYMGDSPIYAHLVNYKDGSWAFRTITASDTPPDSGYLVRLNDLTPAFDTRVAECTPQLYPESHRCNPASPFRDEDSGVLDKIINGTIAVGTGGKITDITYEYETTFDETAFNQAVDEALVNTGLDRRRLISLLGTYDQKLLDARAELENTTEQMLALRAASYDVELDIQPAVSGLTEYYQGDIDFTQLVDIEPADDAPLPTARIEASPILPCDARHCVAAAEAAMATLGAELATNKENIAAGTRPLSRLFDVRCNMVRYDGYLLQAECPDQVAITDDQPVQVPVDVTILSRDFDDLYPEFHIAGPELAIRIDGRTVTFTNRTSEYVTVSAQTVYYNSAVHTTTMPIDIPPGIAVTRELGDFVSPAMAIESRYLQMTPDKADRSSFQFGFAVRYQLASQGEARTLHAMEMFNVGCVIRNRISPGACQPEALADAREPEESRMPAARPGAPM